MQARERVVQCAHTSLCFRGAIVVDDAEFEKWFFDLCFAYGLELDDVV